MKMLTVTQRDALYKEISSKVFLSKGIIEVMPRETIRYTHSNGYRKIEISGKIYQEHVIVWALYNSQWPEELVDHIDGNPMNNNIENLRACTYSENCCNRGMRSDNTLGYKGIFKREQKKGTVYGWMIKLGGKNVSQSGYPTPQAAFAARNRQLVAAHGEFANTGE